jgi:phenylpyruvate tautomerase PptA (4-oxalocrotonate tautomerase family)
MACLITNGISRTCDFAVGGVKSSVWLANEADVTAIAYAATGQVTGVTMASGTTFYEYQPELNSASFAQSLQAGQVSRFVAQNLAFSIASLSQAKVETLNSLSLTTLVAIFQANDGNWYFAGDNGSALKASALEVTTGAADTDDAVATVTLTGSNKGYAPTVSAGVLTALSIS